MQETSLFWKRAKKEPKGQTKILGSASVIWDKFLKFVPKRANLSTLARGMIQFFYFCDVSEDIVNFLLLSLVQGASRCIMQRN